MTDLIYKVSYDEAGNLLLSRPLTIDGDRDLIVASDFENHLDAEEVNFVLDQLALEADL